MLIESVVHEVLNALFRNIALQSEVATVSLHTADPGDTGAGEVSGGSYARQSVSWDTPASGQIANDAVIEFDGMPTATVTHVGLWEGATFKAGHALPASESFSEGQTARIQVGALTVALQEV